MMHQPRTPEERLELEKTLLPFHLLWTSEPFQRYFVGDIIGKDLEQVKAMAMNIAFGKAKTPQTKILDMCGLKEPETYEEKVITAVALMSVVHFFERKLAQIASKSKQYEALKKEGE